MVVFLKKVKKGEHVVHAVAEGGCFGFEAGEDGYIISAGDKTVFITETDMAKANEADGPVRLERYGD